MYLGVQRLINSSCWCVTELVKSITNGLMLSAFKVKFKTFTLKPSSSVIYKSCINWGQSALGVNKFKMGVQAAWQAEELEKHEMNKDSVPSPKEKGLSEAISSVKLSTEYPYFHVTSKSVPCSQLVRTGWNSTIFIGEWWWWKYLELIPWISPRSETKIYQIWLGMISERC